MSLLTTFLFSLFITIAAIPVLKGLSRRMHMLDFPNDRKVHAQPMPKVGGVGMALGIFFPTVFLAMKDRFVLALLVGLSVIFMFGLLDDLKNLSYKIKFFGQIAAALTVMSLGPLTIVSLGDLMPGSMSLPNVFGMFLALFIIVGVTNAINLSDGLDGLAGGISILSFMCIGLLAFQSERADLTLIAIAAIGAIFGFLRFNTHPATVFMGDTGSQMIGFLAAVICIRLTQYQSPYSPLMPLFILGFPILDTLMVMTERMLEGHSPFKADQRHFHHRLLQLGLYHSEAVLAIYAIQAVLILLVYALRYHSEWLLLSIYAVFSLIIVSFFQMAVKNDWRISRPIHLFDRLIKGRLRIVKQKRFVIRLSFATVRYGFGLLFLLLAFMPAQIPQIVAMVCLFSAIAAVLIYIVNPRLSQHALRAIIYFVFPLIVYLEFTAPAAWINHKLILAVQYFHMALAIFLVLTLKYTNRQKGFKANPLDFLILFAAIVIPNLPMGLNLPKSIGLITTQIITIFFGYEVIAGEYRKPTGIYFVAIPTTLILVAVRFFFES